MKEKVISDIRVFKSCIPNIDGNVLPLDVNNKKLNIVIHRIVMKLRENGFSLGVFDHLYLNFTICLGRGYIIPSKRRNDPYHPWYRYYDVGVDNAFYDALDSEQSIENVIMLMEKVLLDHFAKEENIKTIIKSSVKCAISQKESMLMRYKVKKSTNREAVLYLRLLDSGCYYPLFCVYDSDGKELLKKDLSVSADLNPYGTIVLSGKKATINPKSNVFTAEQEPITFNF